MKQTHFKNNTYQQKYLKYKNKYLHQKYQYGGDDTSLASQLCDILSIDCREMTFAGNSGDGYIHGIIEQFKRTFPTDKSKIELLERQLFNTARVCTKCSKALGPSLLKCNNCGTPQVGNDKIADNISSNLVLFLYRVTFGDRPYLKAGGYALTISHPHVSANKSVLVYDDALKLAYIHVNAIPFNNWIPDITYLFNDPGKGMVLINELFAEAKSWAYNIIATTNKPLTDSDKGDIDTRIIAGFNYPPSENQLHLQFMITPFIGDNYCKSQNGDHFTKDRFVFFDYLLAALEHAKTNDVYKQLLCSEITELKVDGMLIKKPVKGITLSAENALKYYEQYFKNMDISDTVTYEANRQTNINKIKGSAIPIKIPLWINSYCDIKTTFEQSPKTIRDSSQLHKGIMPTWPTTL